MDNALAQFLKQPLAVKLVLLVMLLAGIGVVEYQVFYSPKKEKLKTLNNQSNKLKVDLAESQAIADNLPRFREEVAILNEELKRALELLPDNADVQGLYRQLANEGKKTNIELVSFKPGGRKSHGFYSSLSVNVKIKGSFSDIARFIDQSGKLSRIINISNLTFSAPKLVGNRIELSVEAKATTYMFSGGKA